MFTIFILHVLFMSVFAMVLTLLPNPARTVSFYALLSVVMSMGGYLGNIYALPVTEGTIVSGGNLAYGAFMMTTVIFVLTERDSFILPRIIQLVVFVNLFNILASLLVIYALEHPDVLNPHGTPLEMFTMSIPLMALGGALIILELGVMLYVFEALKRFDLTPFLTRSAYFATFVVLLCFDGIAFPLIAFGTSPETIAMTVGGLSGKFLTALSYGAAVIAFTAIFPARFAAFLQSRVFSWSTLAATSSEIHRDLAHKEAALSATQSRIAYSAKLAGLGYAVSDKTSETLVECDEAYARMHGLTQEEMMGISIRDELAEKLVHPDDREKSNAVWQEVMDGQAAIMEARYILPDGQVRWLRKFFSPANPDGSNSHQYEVVGQDVTEDRLTQEKLFQAQKLDALGKLTGGIAHDFNNLMAVTLGNLELLDQEITDPDHKELIRNGVQAILRGSDLTRNMLSFARRAQLAPQSVDLNARIEDMSVIIKRTLPSNIRVTMRLAEGLWPIEIDPSTTDSALLNLILNARDAMPKGGRLTIATSNVVLSAQEAKKHSNAVEPGRYVLLTVSDSGTGIAPEVLEKIFDPFFTTKPVGAGTGLGLSMLEGFMDQSGGTVSVRSEEDVGTTFSLYFPAFEPVEGTAAPADDMVEVRVARGAKVLLVEDDPAVLATIRAALVRAGMQVIDAPSGDAALALFEQQPDIDLLLTDIVMPGSLQGTSLAAALRARRPNLPVIAMSGYAEGTVETHGTPCCQDMLLMKPVRQADLLRAIEQVLAKNRAGCNGS